MLTSFLRHFIYDTGWLFKVFAPILLSLGAIGNLAIYFSDDPIVWKIIGCTAIGSFTIVYAAVFYVIDK